MSPPTRPLKIACYAIVTLWIGAAMAWSALQMRVEPAAAEPSPPMARIQPRPEAAPPAPKHEEPPPEPEPPRPEPAVEPEPEPELPKQAEPDPPAPEPVPTYVRGDDLSAGVALLDGAGAFPVLSCSYEDFRSFKAYARAMRALGARFVVVRNRKILGAIEVATGKIQEGAPSGSFSPRARDYTGEAALADLALAARGRFGRGVVVMMLVPREIDAGLFGGIARALADRGEGHQAYREILGRYERAPGGGVQLRVDAGVRQDGEQIALDWRFDLGQISRLGGNRGSSA